MKRSIPRAIGSLSTSRIEVERKFTPSAQLCSILGLYSETKRTGTTISAPIRSLPALKRQPDVLIRDSYYDRDDMLSRSGIWVRQRTTKRVADLHHFHVDHDDMTIWEAKVRFAGDGINSQFHEVEGRGAVRALLSNRLPGGLPLEKLQLIADIQTHRFTWTATALGNGKNAETANLSIVLDRTSAMDEDAVKAVLPFRHFVGELEMTCEVDDRGSGMEMEDFRREQAQEADGCLEGVMSVHPELFVTQPKPVGKLSAYYEWKNRNAAGAV